MMSKVLDLNTATLFYITIYLKDDELLYGAYLLGPDWYF